MVKSSWGLLAELDARLSEAGQDHLLSLVVRLIHATHHEALQSHEILQAQDAREAKRIKDAARHAIFDDAIKRAAEGIRLEATRKFAESIETVVYAKLLESNYDGKPPAWATIMRRIQKILEENAQP